MMVSYEKKSSTYIDLKNELTDVSRNIFTQKFFRGKDLMKTLSVSPLLKHREPVKHPFTTTSNSHAEKQQVVLKSAGTQKSNSSTTLGIGTKEACDILVRTLVRYPELIVLETFGPLARILYRAVSELFRHTTVDFLERANMNKKQAPSASNKGSSNANKTSGDELLQHLQKAVKAGAPRAIENIIGTVAVEPSRCTTTLGKMGAGLVNAGIRFAARAGINPTAIDADQAFDEVAGMSLMRGFFFTNPLTRLVGLAIEQLGIWSFRKNQPVRHLSQWFHNRFPTQNQKPQEVQISRAKAA